MGKFTAISVESGKIVDVETMSRFCKSYNRNKGQNDSIHDYRKNDEGQTPNIEKGGAEMVFRR